MHVELAKHICTTENLRIAKLKDNLSYLMMMKRKQEYSVQKYEEFISKVAFTYDEDPKSWKSSPSYLVLVQFFRVGFWRGRSNG